MAAPSATHIGGITLWAVRFYQVVLCGLLGVIAALIAAAVVARYVFGAPLVYSYELASMLFVWLVFLSLPGGAQAGVHLSADLIGPALSKRGALWLRIIGHALSLPILAYLFWFAWALAARTRVVLPTLDLSMAWVYAAVPVGAALYAGWIMRDMLRAAHELRVR